MSYCIHCGNELKPEAIFCPNCGSKVIEYEPNIDDTDEPIEHKDEAVSKGNKKVSLMVLLGLLFIVVVLFISNQNTNRSPIVQQIGPDLQESIGGVSYTNPLTGMFLTEELQVDNVRVEERQSERDFCTLNCVVNLSNENYDFTKYVTCYYEKIENEWILEDIDYYGEQQFTVNSCPLTEEDAIAYVSKDSSSDLWGYQVDYSNVSPDGTCHVTVTREENHIFRDSRYDEEIDLFFDGWKWIILSEQSDVSYTWHINGDYEIVDTVNDDRSTRWFEMEVTGFSPETMTVSGTAYCKYQDYIWGIDHADEFDLGDVTFEAYSLIDLNGETQEGMKARIPARTSDHFCDITFFGDTAYAYYGQMLFSHDAEIERINQ